MPPDGMFRVSFIKFYLSVKAGAIKLLTLVTFFQYITVILRCNCHFILTTFPKSFIDIICHRIGEFIENSPLMDFTTIGVFLGTL